MNAMHSFMLSIFLYIEKQARFLMAMEGWAGRYPGWAVFCHHIIT